MQKDQVIETVVAIHKKQFGHAPESVSWAPGRIEVLGNHTDYNEGTVLSAAINLGIGFGLSRSERKGIQLYSVDMASRVDFMVNDTHKVEGADWANYVKGVFYFLQETLGCTFDGFDCTFMGSIPMGAGLSSSAALEVAAAFAILDLMEREMDKKEIAKLCRRAEHTFAGTNCGLLDQFSSIFGREHGLIHSDFRSLDVSAVVLASDIDFLVVNPHVKHSLSDSPYNERRERCEQAAEQFAHLLPHKVTALRDVSWAEFEQHKQSIDPAAAQRAAHVVGEIARVESGRELLKTGDVNGFGELLYESHQSSINNFENSCEELDVVVAAAREAGGLGARLSGGGFGGSAIVMVRAPDGAAVTEKLCALCAPAGFMPEVIKVSPSAGAHVID